MITKFVPSRLKGAVVFACACMSTGVASAANIAVSGTGASVTAGQDNNYQIIADTTGEITAPAQAYLVTSKPTNWASAVAGSEWIAPNPNQSAQLRSYNCCTGSDTYQTTFSLSGLDPGTAILDITLSADDEVGFIDLNGVKVFSGPINQQDYRPGDLPVTITIGFVGGVNYLDFVVRNGVRSTGLDVAISGTALSAASAAEPKTGWLLLCAGLIASVLALRQKRIAIQRRAF